MNRVIYFKGKNCAVCLDLYPKIRTHFDIYYPKLQFEIIEVEDDPKIAAQYLVFTVPTLLVFSDEKEEFRFVRHFSGGQIDEKISRAYHLIFEE